MKIQEIEALTSLLKKNVEKLEQEIENFKNSKTPESKRLSTYNIHKLGVYSRRYSEKLQNFGGKE